MLLFCFFEISRIQPLADLQGERIQGGPSDEHGT